MFKLVGIFITNIGIHTRIPVLIWLFPKIKGPVSVVRIMRIIVYLGLFWGPLSTSKPPIALYSYRPISTYTHSYAHYYICIRCIEASIGTWPGPKEAPFLASLRLLRRAEVQADARRRFLDAPRLRAAPRRAPL